MAAQDHIIRRQVVEFTFPREDNFLNRQEEMSYLLQSRILPAMERAFDKYAPEGVTLRLDRIELDVGLFTSDDLEQEIGRRVQQAMENYLSALALQRPAATAAAQAEPAERIGAEGRDLELVLHYLRTGMLPWWAAQERDSAVARLHELARISQPELVMALVTASREPAVRQRLAQHLPPTLLNPLITAMAPAAAPLLLAAIEFYQSGLSAGVQTALSKGRGEVLLQSAVLEAAHESRTAVAEPQALSRRLIQLLSGSGEIHAQRLLAALLVEEVPVRKRKALEKENVFFAAVLSLAAPLTAEERKVALHEKRSAEGKPRKGLLLPEEAEAIAKRQAASPQPVEEVKRKAAADETPESPAKKKAAASQEEEKAPGRKKAAAKISKNKSKKAAGLLPEELSPEARAAEEALTLEERWQRWKDTWQEALARTSTPAPQYREEVDALFLQSAGLVLLWPFLKHLFGHLGWWQEGAFVNAAAQTRAVFMLHYLATGQAEGAEETRLPFAKILCGLQPGDVIATDVVLTQEECAEGDQLLATVLERWEVLRRTSPQGLRNTFLSREGRVSQEGSNWRVILARETLDVLLDRLPWGIGIIKLPWMQGLILVEW